MKIEKPKATIKPQVQTSTPPNSDTTIMDDTVVTMESATALMGGLTVSQSTMRQSIADMIPKATIKKRR